MIKMLEERRLPALLDREKMLEILQEQVYGKIPPAPESISFKTEEKVFPFFCAGKAVCNKITATCVINNEEFSFPFFASLPTDEKKHPFFIHINFDDSVFCKYMPIEEVIDNGFAVLSFCHNDVTKDNDDFSDGLAGVLFKNGARKPDDPGKIAMWAWAAHRVMDYAETMNHVLDLDCAVVCGHSRLGKATLLAAASDERFPFAYSNNSGCTGAALSRGKQGETVRFICNRFPYWFCENYQKYADNEQSMAFDQHYLVASVAPRRVLVGSASEDAWADPVSEQLCCFAASPAFKKGFVCPDRRANIGEEFFHGDIGYHLRKGNHYFSREDWQKLIKFVNLHREV